MPCLVVGRLPHGSAFSDAVGFSASYASRLCSTQCYATLCFATLGYAMLRRVTFSPVFGSLL